MSGLVTCEFQAKQNKAKYTGVSSEASRMDSRMGGFGSTSSSFGPSGGSALSSLAGGSKGYGSSSGFGSTSVGFGPGSGFNSSSRYDDDYEAGHSALNTEEPAEEASVSFRQDSPSKGRYAIMQLPHDDRQDIFRSLQAAIWQQSVPGMAIEASRIL